MLLLLFISFILCFILGITWMRIGLYNLSGKQLNKWLHRFTETPLKGMAAGTVVTGILHSSAAVMVMTIGFVSAGLITFPQTIGVILGTNIGTTFTLEFISFPIDSFILPAAIPGFLLLFFRNRTARSTGWVLIGLALIFAAMRGFEWLADPLFKYKIVKNIFLWMDHSLIIPLVVGAVFTAAVQSSTATTGMMMSFLQADIVSLDSAISFMIGANIGTCITALLAAIGAGNEARLTAFAHVWLNIGGALIFFPFIHQLGRVSAFFSDGAASQLAHASVIYNILCSMIVLPFSVKFGKLIEHVHGIKK
ncbi:Na/Pi symporter [Falsibacillus pallidus]|uniref:Na/Pi symporter n=1 Tax=Falsibacillus pallidus TaxID=493781 RepID=UPI003D9982F6